MMNWVFRAIAEGGELVMIRVKAWTKKAAETEAFRQVREELMVVNEWTCRLAIV